MLVCSFQPQQRCQATLPSPTLIAQVHLPCSPSHQIWWFSTGCSRHNFLTPLIFPSLSTPQVIYDTKSQHGTLEWTNDSNFGGDGTLKLTAKSVMDADSIKKMPVGLLGGSLGRRLLFLPGPCQHAAGLGLSQRADSLHNRPSATDQAHVVGPLSCRPSCWRRPGAWTCELASSLVPRPMTSKQSNT